MKIDLKKLQNDLSDEQIISLVYALGADRHEDKVDYILFPTICHNEYADEANMKLYYYKEDKRFHCYTDCSDTFNIFELIKRARSIRGEELNFPQVLDFIRGKANIEYGAYDFDEYKYKKQTDKFKKKERLIDLPVYDEGLLKIFIKTYPPEWLKDGITKVSMDKFGILYSISQNKIIIPHYNVDNQLVGIRGRALNQSEIDAGCKYMPVSIEGNYCSHQLGQNLYGLNLSKEFVQKRRKVFVFESEKSCMLYNGLFEENLSVACCGSSIRRSQIDILLKNFDIDEVVLCFDKEYDNFNSEKAEEYFNSIWDMGKKYTNYYRMSFLFDMTGLLEKKDSPIDKGKDKFLELYKKRIYIK